MTSMPQQRLRSDAMRSDYAILKGRIQKAGLLENQSGFYLRSIACKMALLAASLALFVLLRAYPWAIILNTIALAIVFGQLGFQMHDAGHRQMFEKGRANVVVGSRHRRPAARPELWLVG